MVFKDQKNAGFRIVLAVVLIAGIFGVIPARASAETLTELISSSESSLVSKGEDCSPGSGWMWTSGPLKPEVAHQVQQALSQKGIKAMAEARSYGETDSCGTYHHHGIDFTITLTDAGSTSRSSQQGLAHDVLPVLAEFGKPELGKVKLVSPQGELIPINIPNTPNRLSTTQAMDAEALTPDVITKQVYVIVYDPLLTNGLLLSEYLHWNNHAVITQQTVDFFKQSTNNKMNYVIADTTIVTSGWPELIDGFSYTEDEYLAVLFGQQPHHEPTGVSYNKIVNTPEFDICGKLNRGEIDEVWIYNGPWFGFYESTLVGPGAYWFNSPPVGGTHNCNKLLPIMGPSPERTTHEAVHNFTHRAESTMTRVYGSWQENNTSHNWNKFALVKAQSPSYSYSGCGSSHYPPNAVTDYDYSNSSSVLSNCDDFANYPNLGDPLQVSQPVNCTAWGCDDLNYYGYWFGHFPSYPGCGPDNVANDWWKYLANPAYALYPSKACQADMRMISGNVGVGIASMSYDDGGPKTVATDTSGNYFLLVPNHWSGTVTPYKVGYTFTPAGRDYVDVQSDLYGQDYIAQGADPSAYYVNIATGDNSNLCIAIATPCRDIQETVNRASDGDVIYVASGRYLFSTNPTPNVAIIDNKNVTLSGGWSLDFASQNGASTIDGANVNNGILVVSGSVIVENFIIENSISYNGGAIYIVNGSFTLKKSTLRNNIATSNGAGIFLDNGALTIINSTLSGNTANGSGGGIYASLNSGTSVTIQNSTIAYNHASTGGGIRRTNGTYNITNTIIANNSSTTSSPDCSGTIAMANYNIIENTAGCSITSGGNNLNIDPQIDSNLTGVIPAHMLLAGSPAIDAGTASGCPSTDQQGSARPQGSSCDIGSIEYFGDPNTPTFTPTFTPTSTRTNTPTPTNTPTNTPTFTPTATSAFSYNPLYLSLTGSQTIGGVSSSDEDILRFDGQMWSLFFDGSDVGVGSPDLFGFSVVDADTFLMSFSSAVTVNGVAIAPQDIVRFDATLLGSNTAGTFSMYLDGSDVGLDTTAEKIDSVSLLPDGRVLISTTGNPSVPGVAGKDEDVLAFTPSSLGDVTSGSWAMYFDGSDVGLAETSGEDVDALDVVGGKIYLSTADTFSVNGVAGADEDVFICEPTLLGDVTACNYSSTLYFDGSTWGLSANDVDAFNFLSLGPISTSTPTVIPSNTPTNTPTRTPTSTQTRTSTPTNTPTATLTPTLQRGVFDVRILSHDPNPSDIGEAVTFTVSVTDIGGGSAGSVTVNIVSDEGSTSCTTSAISSTCSSQLKFNNPFGHLIRASVGGDFAEVDHYVNPSATTTPTYTPTATSTPIPTNTPNASDLIFADGFESGNLSAWSSSSTDLGDLSVSPAAALAGNQGLQAVINDANAIYLTDDSPNAEPRYRARFYFDPNSIPMTSGDAHYIFKGFIGASTEVFRVEFRQSSGAYQLRAALLDDGTTWVNTNWFSISDASHFIEFDWRAATGVGANDGGLTFWIDNIQQANLIGVDNDTRRIDRARLGALTGIDTGTRGTNYFDAFESRRQSFIGP